MRIRRGGLMVPALALLAVVVAACGGDAVTGPPAPASATTPATSASAATPTPPAAPASPATSASPATTPASAGATVIRDDSLLDILPAEIDGASVTLEEQAFLEAASDPDFAAIVERAAFFVAADADDLVSGLVARLRPGAWSDPFFRDWRDTYDEGACGQAGGVAGNAQAELGGRPVFITSCAGGLLVYHAYLEERSAIVSALAVGEGRFGERLMAGLEP